MDELELGIEEIEVVDHPDRVYAIISNGIPSGKWSVESFEGAEEIAINPNDFEDFNDTEGGIFKVVDGIAVKVGNKEDWLIAKESKRQATKRIAELKKYLDTEWRWRHERHRCEFDEITLGLRECTSESHENIILARKNAVDEINRLEA